MLKHDYFSFTFTMDNVMHLCILIKGKTREDTKEAQNAEA